MPKWLRTLLIVVGVGTVGLVALVYFGTKLQMGTKFAFSGNESVYYSGDATEAQARSLADALKAQGYFSGERKVDVLLRKEKGETIVSFAVQDGTWDKPDLVSTFKTMTEAIAPSVGGTPLTLRLVDESLTVKHETKLP